MRLLVINWFDWTHPLWGGAEVYLHEIFRRLAERGHEVTLLCSQYAGGAREERLDGVRIVRRGHFWTFHLEVPWIYRRELAGGRWDCVFEYTNKVPMLTPLYVEAPLVAVAHHLWGTSIFQESRPPVAAYVWLMERLALPLCYRNTPWVAVSESTRSDLTAAGIPAHRIAVIPNGVDTDRFRPEEGALRPANRTPTIAWIGRMRRYKRVDVLLRAMPLVFRDVPEAQLELAGDGPDAGRLRALAQELALPEDRVRFLGPVSDEAKLELLQRAAVLAQPSVKEGWGRTVLEAGACGVPSVASDVPGLRDSVVHGQSGLLVRRCDPAALAAALSDVLRDSARRQVMGAAARGLALPLNWGASAAATERLAASLSARRRAAHKQMTLPA